MPTWGHNAANGYYSAEMFSVCYVVRCTQSEVLPRQAGALDLRTQSVCEIVRSGAQLRSRRFADDNGHVASAIQHDGELERVKAY